MTNITLTTDFGIPKGFAGIMKGVIYDITPDLKIVDISHTIAPQDIREGTCTPWRAVQRLGAKAGDIVEVIYEADFLSDVL